MAYSRSFPMYELDTHTGEHESAVGRKIGTAPKDHPARPRWGRVLFGLGAFLLLAAGPAFGASPSSSQQWGAIAASVPNRRFGSALRVAIVRASYASVVATLPPTTA